MNGGPVRGEDHPAAEARLLLQGDGPSVHVQLRVADLPDAVHDPTERPGEPPRVEGSSGVEKIVDVRRGYARRRRAVRLGEGDPVLHQDAAPSRRSPP